MPQSKPRQRRAAMTNAERQAAYRKRHLQDVDGKGERLNMVVSVTAKRQLERLCWHYGRTQRAMLERLLKEAEDKAVARMPKEREDAYYAVTP